MLVAIYEAHPTVDLPIVPQVPASTQWHREHGRRSTKAKAVSQKYLSPQEEEALKEFVLCSARNGYPVRVKYLPQLAQAIALQRCSRFQSLGADRIIRAPSKNWMQAFYARHPELKSTRVKAIDLRRHGPHMHDKVREWSDVIGQELRSAGVCADNIYNMDETGVILSAPKSEKVLMRRDERSMQRGASFQRTLITAVECISASTQYR
jgi:Tc5 transposase DNA-binding domain